MKNPEISISKIIESYQQYWWLVLVVLILGIFAGFFINDVAYQDVMMIEFTIPIVVREQPIEEWKPEDTYALAGFVDAWLANEWKLIAGSQYTNDQVYMLQQNDTYKLRIELVYDRNYAQEVRNAFAREIQADVSVLADLVVADLQYHFIESIDQSDLTFVENSACLTDTAVFAQVACVPMTPLSAELLQTNRLDIGDMLWVGERSEVTVQEKMPHNEIVKIISAVICAEVALFIIFLVDLTQKSMGEES